MIVLIGRQEWRIMSLISPRSKGLVMQWQAPFLAACFMLALNSSSPMLAGGHDDHLGLGADMRDDFKQLQASAIP